MKAAVIHGAEQISVESVPDPEPAPDDVVVQVAAVGICGTDLHIYAGHHASSFPIIPGHEVSGTVVAVGSEVDGLRVGDRVAIDPGVFCGRCFQCQRGHTNMCERMGGVGISRPGGMAEYVAAPASKCVVLADGVDLRSAALTEPISCVVHAFDRVRPSYGHHVGIYGAGPIGLIVTSLIAPIAGSVGVVDLNEGRLEWASRAGATRTATSAEDLVPERGFDLVVDCTGAVPAIEDGLRRLNRGGTFLQFGVPGEDAVASFRAYDLFRKEFTVIGSNSGHDSFERAAVLLARGAVDPDLVISDRFPLDEAPAAFAQFKAGKGRKLQIVPGL